MLLVPNPIRLFFAHALQASKKPSYYFLFSFNAQILLLGKINLLLPFIIKVFVNFIVLPID